MSLFGQLRRLYRPDRFQLEDFHTEIVAQVLRNSESLTMAWLGGIGITTLKNPDAILIATQEEFAKLDGHSTDSRPDIAIRLVAGGKTELILIESKIPSKQGPDQLQRYAEHLADAKNRHALQKISLVLITRDYEPTAPTFLAGQTLTLARWFQFYRYLKAHVNGDGLAKELKLFMEENRMSLGNQFRSTDLVSLENFLSAKALMDETLHGEVSEVASKILGGVSTLKKAPNQLRDHHRYVLYAEFGAFECLIGYWLPHENPDEPVWVGITLYSNPWAEARRDVIEAFRGWLKKTAGSWSADDLDDEKEWSCIYKGKAIQALMGETDHVRAIKDQFLTLLKDVEAFQETYPKLPWGTTEADDARDEEDSR